MKDCPRATENAEHPVRLRFSTVTTAKRIALAESERRGRPVSLVELFAEMVNIEAGRRGLNGDHQLDGQRSGGGAD